MSLPRSFAAPTSRQNLNASQPLTSTTAAERRLPSSQYRCPVVRVCAWNITRRACLRRELFKKFIAAGLVDDLASVLDAKKAAAKKSASEFATAASEKRTELAKAAETKAGEARCASCRCWPFVARVTRGGSAFCVPACPPVPVAYFLVRQLVSVRGWMIKRDLCGCASLS